MDHQGCLLFPVEEPHLFPMYADHSILNIDIRGRRLAKDGINVVGDWAAMKIGSIEGVFETMTVP